MGLQSCTGVVPLVFYVREIESIQDPLKVAAFGPLKKRTLLRFSHRYANINQMQT